MRRWGPFRITGRFPMEAPKGGLPVGIEWDDFELEDSTFRVVIPADSIVPHRGHISVTWNKRFSSDGGYSGDAEPIPDFHLALVPVLLAGSADSAIVELTAGLTADSFRLAPVRGLLPVPFDYDVSVLSPFTTEQDLTSDEGWSALLSEIDSIRNADGKPAYYYGVMVPPRGSPLAGVAYVGYPVSIGNLWAMPHELGHNMGLWHAPCGEPYSVDPDYPHEDGRTGTWGYNFWNHVVIPPDEPDMMGYCGMGAISDYHFQKALAHRRERERLWWSVPAAAMKPPPVMIADPVRSDWPPPAHR